MAMRSRGLQLRSRRESLLVVVVGVLLLLATAAPRVAAAGLSRNYYAKTCPNVEALVSCADILALATRDVVQQAGGPSYPVELGRLDGKVGTRAVVKHSLPGAGFSLDQLNKLFAANGLTQTDMIALSGGHTIGVTHCDKFVRRLYTFKGARPQYSPPMNLAFLRQMRGTCPLNYSPATVAMLDAVTPNRFDNGYYQTLQQQKGLLSSDQVLFADRRSRATVNHFASNQTAFFDAFVAAMAKLGRIGVKTAGSDAEIRRVCTKVN
ncbi:unnamed protein product [Triticum turgidum subsp. durum]|uniref:Plant heme peroxidase family profile domain-containing protein n=1 Tax=Triticum turgidum subsp. durum TaxID=4567 RepID=A0A9R1BTC1_TRITD|nr:unnamed protein product [Triticum turgidum subsp. durum]